MSTAQQLLAEPTSMGAWKVVPERSAIRFKCRSMWGLMPVKGHFSGFSGDGQITDSQKVFGRIDVKAESLDTKVRKRDEHLRSADFFDVGKYPDISLVVTDAEKIDGDVIDLRAQLTVKATTAPLLLRVEVVVLGDGAVRMTTQAAIDRKDFGVDGNLMGMVVDDATIFGDVVFRRG